MAETQEILNLIELAKAGNENAYNKLLNTYWSDVYRFQFSKTNNESEAEDITIKTFAKAFDKLELYDTSYIFKNWILTISKNIFIDSVRIKKTTTESISSNDSEVYEITDSEPTPEDQLIHEQNLSELLSCIKQLKSDQQEMIQLRYFQEKSYKEITEITGESMSSVKVKLLRSKKLLSDIITKRNDQNS